MFHGTFRVLAPQHHQEDVDVAWEMPGMRLAWAIVSGSIRVSFWRASVDKDWIEL